jgi:dynein heavy chain
MFGGHASPTVRLSDTWFLNTKEFIWSRAKNDKAVEENKESAIGAPPPRANAGACYYNGKIYIYGGHGGLNYARVSLDDIYTFDLEEQVWERIEPVQGLQPLPPGRGGHSIFIYEDKLYSYGGWNAEFNYNNVIVFDLHTKEWNDPDIYNEISRWNHSAIMVEAIPSWKYFIMGGESGTFHEGQPRAFGACVDTACFLDIKELRWSTIQPEGKEKPASREYSSMAYDSDDARLIVFGGWNSGWLNDLYTLNVSKIVGPPYAIESIDPPLSQLTGNVPLKITGVGFRDNSPMVYFTVGKTPTDVPSRNSVHVPGVYVSETEMTALSPNFIAHGPREAVVQLSMSSKDLTTTFCDFSFFLNTRAHKSLCFGTGLLPDMAVGEPVEFLIQARNDSGANRESGRDVFTVSITTNDDPAEEVEATIRDSDDGQYHVTYTVDKPISVKISIQFKDEKDQMVDVRGSPYSASFNEETPAKLNALVGPALQKAAISRIEELQNFMRETSEGVNIKEKDLSDVKLLIAVKDNVEITTKRNDEVMLQLDQLQESLRLLLANNLAKESHQK